MILVIILIAIYKPPVKVYVRVRTTPRTAHCVFTSHIFYLLLILVETITWSCSSIWRWQSLTSSQLILNLWLWVICPKLSS